MFSTKQWDTYRKSRENCKDKEREGHPGMNKD